MAGIVYDYAKKVESVYISKLGSRSSGALLSTVETSLPFIGGYKNDRYIGEVKVGSARRPYGAADEFGRTKYAQYDGSGDLRDSLHAVLPYTP